MTAGALDRYLNASRERHVEQLCELVRIPSVSALREHAGDVRRAAEWIAAELARLGGDDVEVCATAGHPVVVGRWPAPTSTAPTLLVYGHYDVQPADPLDAWTTPAFVPDVRDGRVYGRGASDDKGNVLIALKAIEALRATGSGPPLGLVVVIEGEEEIGSPSLPRFLEERREQLRADAAISADGTMWSADVPSLVVGAKGLLALELRVRTAAHDLHSGLHGGMAPNATLALAHALARTMDGEGRVLVEGFYDGAAHPSETERTQVARAPFDEAAYRAAIGARALIGEPGFSPLERNWHRPTLDVSGVWGGFQAEGTKTVIPAQAGAKLTCRLAVGQDPERVAQAIERHLGRVLPSWASAQVERQGGSCRAFAVEHSHPLVRAASAALRASYDIEPVLMRIGGSLPVGELLQRTLGIDTVMLSWSMPDENLHAPDEFVRLESFDRGVRVYADLLQRLAELPPSHS